MRYLSKIIFINSASVVFSEIELNGNVHFIGTQGVGKSTLLRAILFFYNADKTKLGIPREKKRFDEYYFQYQNSYIVYEVVRDGNPFCVLAYKKNGRVAMRFFDAPFSKDFFIDKSNKAFESWEKIRTALHKNGIPHSKLITGYEEYRQIIYGDNKGLKPEFRKYALLESKQFQNIPRTIQNVLLNSKLEASFIKETIIKSLNEEEIKIDLRNYSKSHLRDFETELNDIKVWSKKNRKGEFILVKAAESVIENYRGYNHLTQEKADIARQLVARLHYIEQHKPLLATTYETENVLLQKKQNEVANLAQLHQKRERINYSAIDQVKSKLKEAATKKSYYESQNIEEVKRRVSNKELLTQEGEQLKEEKQLLTSNFAKISYKYEALIEQAGNQLQQFYNQKNAAINQCNSQFVQQKDKINKNYSSLEKQISNEYGQQLDLAQSKVESLKNAIHRLEKQKATLRHQEFFKEELDGFRKKAGLFEKTINNTKHGIIEHTSEIKTLRVKWEQEESKINLVAESKIEKQQAAKEKCLKKTQKIQDRIAQSKSAFYGWLNENVQGWEQSIGKVIDEEILFSNALVPELSSNNGSLYGVKINLDALENKAKTVAQYQAAITALLEETENIQQEKQATLSRQQADLNNLKKRFQPKINSLKDDIAKAEYDQTRARTKLADNQTQWKNKRLAAKEEKTKLLASLDQNLDKTSNDKLTAQGDLSKIQEELKRKIQRKNKEKNNLILQEKQANDEKTAQLKTQIAQQEVKTRERIQTIKAQQNNELESKGADSLRLADIEKRLEAIAADLNFIKDNERLFFEYEKDKRELFDKIPHFKTQKEALEKKQQSMEENHRQESLKLRKKHHLQREKVDQIKENLRKFEADLDKFELFKKSTIYTEISSIFDEEVVIDDQQETVISIIDQLNETHNKAINIFNELRRLVTTFTGNFKEHNVFSFKTVQTSDEDYLKFARGLKEFMAEDKIGEYQKRVNEKFAHIIQLIGKETQHLDSKAARIENVIRKINNDFSDKNFVGAIKNMEIRTQPSSNKIMKLLLAIKEFNDEHAQALGEVNLFNIDEQSRANKNEKAVNLLKKLVKDLAEYKPDTITLSESFDLQFRIVENDNDSGWVEKLANVGSEGTDVLVKAMINILLLNVFKENASKRFKEFKLHCMMDEVGRLHPNNVKGILRFANDRNILLINGSPTSLNAADYRYTYNLSKKRSATDKKKYNTHVKRIIKALRNSISSEAGTS